MLRVEMAVSRAQARPRDSCRGRPRTPSAARARVDVDADRRDRADDRSRRDRLREPGRRDRRPGRPLPPLRPDQQRRRRHGASPCNAGPAIDRLLADARRRDRRPRPAGLGSMPTTLHDGPHALGARRADHVRPQVRGLGVRARPRPDAPAGRGWTTSPTGKLSGPVGTYSQLRPGDRGGGHGRARARRRSGEHADRPARPPCRLPGGDRGHRRLAGAVRDRDPQPPAHGDRRGPGAVPRGPEGLERDAAQAQPNPVRATRRPRPAAPRATRWPGWRTRRCGTSAISATRRWSASRCPAPRSCSTTCWSASGASWTASSCARSGCARTSSAAWGCTPPVALLTALVEDGGLSPRGRLRDRPAQRAAGGRRAASVRATWWRRIRGFEPRSRPSVLRHASTTGPCSATQGRSWRAWSASSNRGGRHHVSADDLELGYVRSGKVRDLYALDGDRLLLVASDRISAFDVVLPTPIPDKGRVLTGLSRYWFAGNRCRRDRAQPSPQRRPGRPAAWLRRRRIGGRTARPDR